MENLRFIHVAYKSSGISVIDLLAGHVQSQFSSLPVVINHVRMNKLRMLAQTGAKLSPAVKDIPTMVETGVPGFVVSSGFGMFAPAASPRPVIDRVHSTLAEQGADPVASTPEEFAAFMCNEIAKWIKVARDSGIQPEYNNV